MFIESFELRCNLTGKVFRYSSRKKNLSKYCRNLLVRQIFNELYGTLPIMDIYQQIYISLKDYNINLSERSIMRILNSF